MVSGITFDTAKADALCHTDVEDGRYMELYRDPEGRFFIVHYSFWQKEDATITRKTRPGTCSTSIRMEPWILSPAPRRLYNCARFLR